MIDRDPLAGDDGSAKDEFVLGYALDQPQSIKWPQKLSLFAHFAKTDEDLRRLRNKWLMQPAANPNVCLVDGIWLVWCYASADITALRQEVFHLRRRIEKLERLAGIVPNDQSLPALGPIIDVIEDGEAIHSYELDGDPNG